MTIQFWGDFDRIVNYGSIAQGIFMVSNNAIGLVSRNGTGYKFYGSASLFSGISDCTVHINRPEFSGKHLHSQLVSKIISNSESSSARRKIALNRK